MLDVEGSTIMKNEIERHRWHAMKMLWRLCASSALLGAAPALLALLGGVSPSYSDEQGFLYTNGTYAPIRCPCMTGSVR